MSVTPASATSVSAIEAKGVAFAYKDCEALRGVDFTVAKHAVHGFLGPNGSGKSTLFKLLATILPLSRGSVTVLGRDLATEPAALREKLGVVFQSPALDKKLSVRRNLVYGGQMFGLGGADLQRRVDAMLEYAGLTDRAGDVVGELSGGLRRRAEIAKGMLHEPELLLLDEPTTGLDPGARQDLWKFLREREGVTVLFTTHLMEEAAEADQLTLLHEGAVVAAGTPAELVAGIGGEVLELVTAEPDALAAAIAAAHSVDAKVVEGRVRVEAADAHKLVPALMKAHADAVDELRLSKPSLADVFLARTGRRLADHAGEARS